MKVILFFFFLILSGCSSVKIDPEKKISKHFYMRDAISSWTAKKYDLDNTPNKEDQENIEYAAKRLDEVRDFLGKPLSIQSWYRSEKVNKKAGGAPRSSHLQGLAIDFRINDNMPKVYEKIRKSKLDYDQLIYYPRTKLIHIGFKRKKSEEKRTNTVSK